MALLFFINANQTNYMDGLKNLGDDGSLDFEDNEGPTKVKEEPIPASKTTWQIEHEQYQRLCRGDAQRPQKLLKQLECKFNYGTHPFLRLMPHKEEVVNLKPKISIFHDVLTQSEIETIKGLATPRVSILLFI